MCMAPGPRCTPRSPKTPLPRPHTSTFLAVVPCVRYIRWKCLTMLTDYTQLEAMDRSTGLVRLCAPQLLQRSCCPRIQGMSKWQHERCSCLVRHSFDSSFPCSCTAAVLTTAQRAPGPRQVVLKLGRFVRTAQATFMQEHAPVGPDLSTSKAVSHSMSTFRCDGVLRASLGVGGRTLCFSDHSQACLQLRLTLACARMCLVPRKVFVN